MTYFTPDELFALFAFFIGLPFSMLLYSLSNYWLEKAKYYNCMGRKLFPERYKTFSTLLKSIQ